MLAAGVQPRRRPVSSAGAKGRWRQRPPWQRQRSLENWRPQRSSRATPRANARLRKRAPPGKRYAHAGMATRKQAPPESGYSRALRTLAATLDDLGLRGMLIGGAAVIARGVPRTTRDIDATIVGGEQSISAIIGGFARHGLVPRIEDAQQFAAEHQVLLLVHQPSQIEVDLSLAWLSFELDAVTRAETLELAGVRIPVARAEDLVIYKAIAWRPQDQLDIERLLMLHWDQIDFERVRHVVAELGEALESPERIVELDIIARRVSPE